MGARWRMTVATLLALATQCMQLEAQRPERLGPSAIDSLLGAGAVDRARAAARRLTEEHPDDPRGYKLLGSTLLAGSSPRPREALRAFREAAALVPRDTAVWEGVAEAALRMGGPNGERVAREALEHLLALDPVRPTAWEEWLGLYRSRGDRTRMRRILESGASRPVVAIRIAHLLVEDGQYAGADSLLDTVLRSDSANVGALTLRAQSAFEAGADSTGFGLYESALRHASRDPAPLWRQVIGIATPEEIRAWDAGPRDPERFLRAFWARRHASLFEPANARIAEHFHRLRTARSRWPLMHPLSSYQRSRAGGSQEAWTSAGEEVFFQRCEVRRFVGRPGSIRDAGRALSMPSMILPDVVNDSTRDLVPMPGVLSLPPDKLAGVLAQLVHYGRSLLNVDTTAAAVGYNRRTGLDDRGLVYLRFGEPARKLIGSPNSEDPFCAIPDLELWEYDDVGTVRFFRPSAVSVIGGGVSDRQTGDVVLRPMNDPQFAAATVAVTRDATSVPAPLSFGAWFAQLRGSDSAHTAIVVATSRGAAAAELVPDAGLPGAASSSPSGVVAVQGRAGRALLLVHAQVGDTLGRQSLPLTVRSLAPSPALSDLLVAHPWGDTVVTRDAMLAHLSRDLTFEAGARVRVAAEVYDLPKGPAERVRYGAVYRLARSDAPTRAMRQDSLGRATVLSFEQERRARGGVVLEWVDIDTYRLEPGRYLLRLDVMSDGRHVGRAQAVVRLVERQ